MILAHLLNENRRVGLKELSKQYFGEDSTQESEEMKASVLANDGAWLKSNKEMYKADPKVLAKYGAKDAMLTYKLFLKLVPELYEQNLDKFFYEDESMPLLRTVTYELNTVGLQVDMAALSSLKATLKAECAEAKDFIYKEIKSHIQKLYPGTNKKNTFNIGSSSQLGWLMFGELALEFSTLTKEGKILCKAMGMKLPYWYAAQREFIATCIMMKGSTYQSKGAVKKIRDPWNYIQCDKKTLQKLSNKYKWIATLLEYQRKIKLLTTYVEGMEDKIHYGIVQPGFLQHGTTSGRYASRSPNFQNLPRDDKRVKQCIVARAGKVFVGADYSQLEPRVFASISGDEKLLASFKTDDDFYSVIGMEVYDKYDCIPKKDGSPMAFGVMYKNLRDLSKVIALASTYGATAYQLSGTTKKSAEDTQRDIEQYFERFPKVKEMMLLSHEQAKQHGVVYNTYGRPRRIPEATKINKAYGKNTPHADLPYEARKLLNLSVNHRIQSTGASIVNRAAIAFHNKCKEIGIYVTTNLQVHDSLIAECNIQDADIVKELLKEAMENTTRLPGIELEALPKIGTTLADV